MSQKLQLKTLGRIIYHPRSDNNITNNNTYSASASISDSSSNSKVGLSTASTGSSPNASSSSSEQWVTVSAVVSATPTGTDAGVTSTGVIVLSTHAAIPTEFAGPLAATLLGTPNLTTSANHHTINVTSASDAVVVTPKCVIALSAIPYTTFTLAPVARATDPAFLSSLAGTVSSGNGNGGPEEETQLQQQQQVAVGKALKRAPLLRSPDPACPPLLYSLLSPAAVSLLSNNNSTNDANNGGAGSQLARVPMLPPPTVLFGLDAALAAQATVLSLPFFLFASVDNAHHYAGETLLAWSRGAGAAAEAAAAAGATAATAAVVSAALLTADDAFLPPGAIASSGGAQKVSEVTRVRAYRAWRAEAEAAAPKVSLKNRDVGQHKYARFANKAIPHGIFA